jgi:ribosomal protein S18 acetylase RimI-like enzyme
MNLSIRNAKPEDAHAMALVNVATWSTTYRGIISDHILDNLTTDGRESAIREMLSGADQAVFGLILSDENDKVYGFAIGGPERNFDPIYSGELYSIYILEESQGLGLGRQMARLVAKGLAERGHKALLVWALRDNPFCRFYEALGGIIVYPGKEVSYGGQILVEVAYGWKDINTLIYE